MNKYLTIISKPRYWEDSQIKEFNSNEYQYDTEEGDIIPCKNNSLWELVVDIEYGKILNWTNGVSAKIHYKVVDQGNYVIFDNKLNCTYHRIDEYVPKFLSIDDNGYGDYIIITIDENGFIRNWNPESIEIEENYLTSKSDELEIFKHKNLLLSIIRNNKIEEILN